MNNEHWVTTLINSMAAKIIAFALLGLLTVSVCVGLFTNKHVNILGIEFNYNDTIQKIVYSKPDTVQKIKIDTVKIYDKKQETPEKFFKVKKQIQDTNNYKKSQVGTIGIQNNAQVHGDQAGRDMYKAGGDMYVNTDRKLNEQDKIYIKNKIDSIKLHNKTKSINCAVVFLLVSSKGLKFGNEVKKYVTALGYEASGVNTLFRDETFEGIEVYYVDGCIEVEIGML